MSVIDFAKWYANRPGKRYDYTVDFLPADKFTTLTPLQTRQLDYLRFTGFGIVRLSQELPFQLPFALPSISLGREIDLYDDGDEAAPEEPLALLIGKQDETVVGMGKLFGINGLPNAAMLADGTVHPRHRRRQLMTRMLDEALVKIPELFPELTSVYTEIERGAVHIHRIGEKFTEQTTYPPQILPTPGDVLFKKDFN